MHFFSEDGEHSENHIEMMGKHSENSRFSIKMIDRLLQMIGLVLENDDFVYKTQGLRGSCTRSSTTRASRSRLISSKSRSSTQTAQIRPLGGGELPPPPPPPPPPPRTEAFQVVSAMAGFYTSNPHQPLDYHAVSEGLVSPQRAPVDSV